MSLMNLFGGRTEGGLMLSIVGDSVQLRVPESDGYLEFTQNDGVTVKLKDFPVDSVEFTTKVIGAGTSLRVTKGPMKGKEFRMINDFLMLNHFDENNIYEGSNPDGEKLYAVGDYHVLVKEVGSKGLDIMVIKDGQPLGTAKV